MGPDKPLLQIADRAVSQRYDRLGSLAQSRAQRLRARDMQEPAACKPVNRFSPSV
jgi:hypothetical protein